MRKAVTIFFVAIIGLFTFVACNPDSSLNNELVNVTITSRDTRSLEASTDFDISSVTKWTYTAEKADNGLKTGETTEQVELVDGKTAQLSQGSWNFTLYGYNSENELICSGSVDNKTITTTNNSVVITVGPLQTENGNGSIHILSDIALVDAKGNKYEEKEGSLTYTKNIYLYDSTGKELSLTNNDLTYDNAKSGFYCVKVEYVAKANDGTEYVAASGYKYFNVYDNLTTIISGTIEESTTSTDISISGDVATVSKKVNLSENGSMLDVTASPLEVGNKNAKTSITIPANSVENTSDVDFSLVVYSAKYASSCEKFIAESGNSVVAGLDITLKNGESEITSFNNNSINVVTYIAKGLANVGVKYNGDGEQPTFVSYDDKTGRLEFTTTHLSEYYVVSSSVAVNENNLAFSTLKEAVENSTQVVLLQNCTSNESIGSKNIENSLLVGKKIELYLNGFNISFEENKYFIIYGYDLTVYGPGLVEEKEPFFSPFIVTGSNDDSVKTNLTLKDGVESKGWTGIFVDQNANNKDSSIASGITINVNDSTLVSVLDTNEDAGSGVYVNGALTATYKSAPQINLSNTTIISKGEGIYAAGYAKWSIENCSITGEKTAIEIRAGEMSINGGEFISTASKYDVKANGNGSTVEGAALAISQHTTKLDIIVDVKGNATFNAIHPITMENPQNNNDEEQRGIKLVISDNTSLKTDDIYGATAFISSDEEKVNGKYFASLQKAFSWVEKDERIILLSDTINDTGYESYYLRWATNITLDLNGHSISNSKAFSSYYHTIAVIDLDCSSMTIEDTSDNTDKRGTIKGNCAVFAINLTNNSDLTIKDGLFIGSTTVVQVESGKLTIEGGSFDYTNAEPTKFLINCIDKAYKKHEASIVVKGGSFRNFDPSNNTAEGESTNYLSEGYKSTLNGEWYEVSAN